MARAGRTASDRSAALLPSLIWSKSVSSIALFSLSLVVLATFATLSACDERSAKPLRATPQNHGLAASAKPHAHAVAFDPTIPPPWGLCWKVSPDSPEVVLLGGYCRDYQASDCPCKRVIPHEPPFDGWTCWSRHVDGGAEELIGLGDACVPGDSICGCGLVYPWRLPRDQGFR